MKDKTKKQKKKGERTEDRSILLGIGFYCFEWRLVWYMKREREAA